MTSFINFTLVILFLLGFVSISVLHLIYLEQNVPYMDEIFHVKQAQSYCNGNWSEWHPKITTFPGLYIISYIFLKPINFLGFKDFCSLYALRMTNIIATLLNFILSLQIIKSLEKNHNTTSHSILKLFSALNIAIFPPLYFFTFLFYTDVWSTTFILLMYNLYLSKKKFLKVSVSLSGCMAVLMRQTNIIWIGLLLINSIWKVLSQNLLKNSSEKNNFLKEIQILYSVVLSSDSKKRIHLIKTIFLETYHYIFICGAFCIFILYNKSIVLGDKTAHTPVLHLMQNMYFLNFAMFFGLPYVTTEVLALCKKPPNTFLIVLILGLCTALSELNKIEHPYLLADNRHLAFYTWKRLFGHTVIRRLLIPTYVASGFLFYRLLQNKRHQVFTIALSICTVLNLTPQHLFEFRYFIIPFIMWRLQFPLSSKVLLETIFFTVINVLVIYLFFNKTFTWSSEPGAIQRIIW